MEGNQGTSQPTATPTGPEAGAAETPSASEKVLYNGQEMEVENFLKTRKHKVKVDGKYTFIVGCGRAGTTLLFELL